MLDDSLLYVKLEGGFRSVNIQNIILEIPAYSRKIVQAAPIEGSIHASHVRFNVATFVKQVNSPD